MILIQRSQRGRSEVLDSVLLLLFLPEGEVFLEELDDGFGISEGFFINIVDLLKSIGKSLFTKLTGLFMVVHNLIVEN